MQLKRILIQILDNQCFPPGTKRMLWLLLAVPVRIVDGLRVLMLGKVATLSFRFGFFV